MASPPRHRVTIDLRGTDERLQAFAAARHLTIAASVRRAIDSMLAGDGEAEPSFRRSRGWPGLTALIVASDAMRW